MPIKKQLGVTSYLNYGGGRGLYQGEAKQPGAFEPRIFGIKVHWHFQTFARHHYGGGEVYMWQPYADNRLMVQRTEKKQAELTAQYSGLEAVAGDYSKYIKSGASIVANLGQAYRTSSTENKQRILGSILVGNLVFDKPIYRTIPFNTAVSSLAFTFKELAGPKKEKPSSYAELSYLAPLIGLSLNQELAKLMTINELVMSSSGVANQAAYSKAL